MVNGIGQTFFRSILIMAIALSKKGSLTCKCSTISLAMRIGTPETGFTKKIILVVSPASKGSITMIHLVNDGHRRECRSWVALLGVFHLSWIFPWPSAY